MSLQIETPVRGLLMLVFYAQWAAGLFFLAGIPLLCWGVGSELIEEGI